MASSPSAVLPMPSVAWAIAFELQPMAEGFFGLDQQIKASAIDAVDR